MRPLTAQYRQPVRRVWPTLPVVAGILAACHWGPTAETFAPAHRPGGGVVVLETSHGSTRAELLAAEDSGLVVLGGSHVAFASYAVIRRARLVEFGLAYRLGDGRVLAGGQLARVRLVGRFPQGIGQDLLARLLALQNQTEVEVLK
jgi:hypothetical protein